MSESAGYILAIGGTTMVNGLIFNDDQNHKKYWKVAVATGLAAVIFAGMESMAGPKYPKAIAMLALVTVFIAPLGGQPSPFESGLKWFNKQ